MDSRSASQGMAAAGHFGDCLLTESQLETKKLSLALAGKILGKADLPLPQAEGQRLPSGAEEDVPA